MELSLKKGDHSKTGAKLHAGGSPLKPIIYAKI
jgi:hypothetical protein